MRTVANVPWSLTCTTGRHAFSQAAWTALDDIPVHGDAKLEGQLDHAAERRAGGVHHDHAHLAWHYLERAGRRLSRTPATDRAARAQGFQGPARRVGAAARAGRTVRIPGADAVGFHEGAARLRRQQTGTRGVLRRGRQVPAGHGAAGAALRSRRHRVAAALKPLHRRETSMPRNDPSHPDVESFLHKDTGTWTHVVHDGDAAAIIDPVLDYDAASARTSTAS